MLKREAKIGISTLELNQMAEKLILELGGIPYNKGYKPSWAKSAYPYATCIGVNECIAHGFPTTYNLKDGDLVSFDLGVKKDGLCGDGAITIPIGNISRQDERLLRIAYNSLIAGLSKVKAGAFIRDISSEMEGVALRQDFVVNKIFMGHGIGKDMHEAPNIPNYYIYKNEEQLIEGQMICLEPMVTKKDNCGIYINDWTVITRDGKKSAVFEVQVKVEKNGYKLLTTHLNG